MAADRLRSKKASGAKAEAQSPPARSAAPPIFGFDPNVKHEDVDIVSSVNGWSEFELADGTKLRAKAAILEVKRAVDQFNTEGEPVYLAQTTVIIQAKSPEHLKKKK